MAYRRRGGAWRHCYGGFQMALLDHVRAYVSSDETVVNSAIAIGSFCTLVLCGIAIGMFIRGMPVSFSELGTGLAAVIGASGAVKTCHERWGTNTNGS